MRKYKQVKEKKVVYSLDEWAVIEQRAADLAMKTGTYIKRISVDGQINYYQPSEYKIGNTTYIVELYFNLDGKEILDEIIERLVHNELEKAA